MECTLTRWPEWPAQWYLEDWNNHDPPNERIRIGMTSLRMVNMFQAVLNISHLVTKNTKSNEHLNDWNPYKLNYKIKWQKTTTWMEWRQVQYGSRNRSWSPQDRHHSAKSSHEQGTRDNQWTEDWSSLAAWRYDRRWDVRRASTRIGTAVTFNHSQWGTYFDLSDCQAAVFFLFNNRSSILSDHQAVGRRPKHWRRIPLLCVHCSQWWSWCVRRLAGLFTIWLCLSWPPLHNLVCRPGHIVFTSWYYEMTMTDDRFGYRGVMKTKYDGIPEQLQDTGRRLHSMIVTDWRFQTTFVAGRFSTGRFE